MKNFEARLQHELVSWFRKKYALSVPMPLIYYCNNTSAHVIQGSNNKAMGLMSGLPDLHVIYSKGRHFYIELKLATSLSQKQKHIHQLLKDNETECHVCRGWEGLEQMKEIITNKFNDL